MQEMKLRKAEVTVTQNQRGRARMTSETLMS